MHVVIGGGSGFIGTALSQALRARGDTVTVISRTAGKGRITWEDVAAGRFPQCDAVVNLAGKHILDLRRRWTPAYRNEVIDSRVNTTTALVNTLNTMEEPPRVFVSTAGKCFYGTGELGRVRSYPVLHEDSEPMGIDFPAEMVGRWEQAAEGIDDRRIRHVRLRIGIVLAAVERQTRLGKLWRVGKVRGILPLMRLPFCLGAGASFGHGRQPFPWIHIDDVVGILLHVIDRRDLAGRFNAVAPEITDSLGFSRSLAEHLNRPLRWSVPTWLVKWVVGAERASILLEGQNVQPRRTLRSGYRFRFPQIEAALDDLIEITL
ncbi:MAG: TIGR01777 family oxidoreductase [Pseudomonadota bacterium]